MPSKIITSVDVFADNDESHPVASIQRKGDGKFRVLIAGEPPQVTYDEYGNRIGLVFHDFDTIKKAEKFATEIAELVEADITLTSGATQHVRNLAAVAEAALNDQKVAHAAEIEALKAELQAARDAASRQE